jgi:hypothetical protein
LKNCAPVSAFTKSHVDHAALNPQLAVFRAISETQGTACWFHWIIGDMPG